VVVPVPQRWRPRHPLERLKHRVERQDHAGGLCLRMVV
jgi:hypothetical protein